MVRLNATDCYHGDEDRSRDLFDKWNARSMTVGMSRRLEHCSGDAPAGARFFRSDGFFDAVNTDARGDIRCHCTRLRNSEGMRGELNPPGSDSGGDIHSVVHYQPAARGVLEFCER